MVLVLPRTDIRRCLNMAEAVEAMHIAYGALRSRLAQAPQRMAVGLSEQGVAVASHIYTRARELGIGIDVDV